MSLLVVRAQFQTQHSRLAPGKAEFSLAWSAARNDLAAAQHQQPRGLQTDGLERIGSLQYDQVCATAGIKSVAVEVQDLRRVRSDAGIGGGDAVERGHLADM